MLTTVTGAMADLCNGLKSMLPVAAMLMIILAGVIYASGQMMGAETRARANVWATAALTGALIAILIAVIAPPVLAMISGDASGTLTALC
jgi:nitrogen fixation/metabolism regulation signal transduction histidine kinase